MNAPAQISMQIETEILSVEEIVEITGRARKEGQIAWLLAKGWKHSTNAAGVPIVGRWYARMKLAGVELSEAFSPQIAPPDFSKAR